MRLLLTEAAHDQDYLQAYDLANAFIQAQIGRDVFCRLPPVWAAKHGHQIAELKKALYGLVDAPKLWYVSQQLTFSLPEDATDDPEDAGADYLVELGIVEEAEHGMVGKGCNVCAQPRVSSS